MPGSQEHQKEKEAGVDQASLQLHHAAAAAATTAAADTAAANAAELLPALLLLPPLLSLKLLLPLPRCYRR